MRKFFAFSLAEALITLIVVGILAVLTIPNLLLLYKQQRTVLTLKKAYSVFSQAVLMSAADNGAVDTWDLPENNEESLATWGNKYLIPYLNIGKVCGVSKGCFAEKNYLLSTQEATNINSSNSLFKFTMNNGWNIAFYKSSMLPTGVIIYVDLNGHNGPNIRGKDIFEFKILQQKYNGEHFITNGATHTLDELKKCNFKEMSANEKNSCCNKSSSGFYCASHLMLNGWKMSADYPW